MKGRIHSLESMGLVDGPGVRAVVFMQGCRLRCLYCHNPDTWELYGGQEIEARELVRRLSRFIPYFRDTGGVTFSGGEPLMQPAFLTECLERCKNAGISTCIDTAGQAAEGTDQTLIERILDSTDLILFDVKHFDPKKYTDITGGELPKAEAFLHKAEDKGIPFWLRHVVVPGLTDGEDHMNKLKEYSDHIRGVQKVELLPYHLAGIHKYERLEIPYQLNGVPAMSRTVTEKYENELFCQQERKTKDS